MLRLSRALFLTALSRWSRRYSSASVSLILTLDSTSRSRRRVSSSWSRRSLRNSRGEMPSAATRLRSSVRLISFWRATVCSAWSIATSSTLMPFSFANCSCARSVIRRSSTRRVSSARGTRSASGFSRIRRVTRDCTSVLVIGSELTSATMYSAARCTGAAAGPAGRAAGGTIRGPARMMSVMPLPERKPCAPAVAAMAARQPRVMRERMCFMA
ncbi:hypothetical protein D9M69_539920 [compost metagenome]